MQKAFPQTHPKYVYMIKWEDFLSHTCSAWSRNIYIKFDFGSCSAIEQVSNKFYFTFSIHPEAVKDGVRIRNVVPATEEEALRVIERMDAENSHIAAS